MPWYRPHGLRLFRDASDLAASSALWSSLERALTASRCLIVLASPEAAASPWCDRECRWWLGHAPADHLPIVLTGGDIVWDPFTGRCDAARTTALPFSLVNALAEEPLYVDLRWARDLPLEDEHPRWQAAVLDLAAPLRGVPKVGLEGEAVRMRRRNRRWIVGTLSSLTVLALLATGMAGWRATRHLRPPNAAAPPSAPCWWRPPGRSPMTPRAPGR